MVFSHFNCSGNTCNKVIISIQPNGVQILICKTLGSNVNYSNFWGVSVYCFCKSYKRRSCKVQRAEPRASQSWLACSLHRICNLPILRTNRGLKRSLRGESMMTCRTITRSTSIESCPGFVLRATSHSTGMRVTRVVRSAFFSPYILGQVGPKWKISYSVFILIINKKLEAPNTILSIDFVEIIQLKSFCSNYAKWLYAWNLYYLVNFFLFLFC